MIRQHLHGGWQLTATTSEVPDHVRDRTVPATVPGSSHLDLLAAGLIPDPLLDRAETELAWMHRADWRYRTTFPRIGGDAGRAGRPGVRGLDTVAVVELNGHVLGRTANMHRGYRFDVRERLATGGNDLAVTFSSALAHAEAMEAELGAGSTSTRIRSTWSARWPASFGWDWGPDLQTAGIWRPVRLERWHDGPARAGAAARDRDPDGTGTVELHARRRVDRATDDVALEHRRVAGGRPSPAPSQASGAVVDA